MKRSTRYLKALAMALFLAMLSGADVSADYVYAPCIEDTYVDSYYPSTPQDGQGLLKVGHFARLRTYLKFDLSDIPSGATVTDVELWVYYNSAWTSGLGPGNYTYRVWNLLDDSWSESTLTWNNKPNHQALVASHIVAVPTMGDSKGETNVWLNSTGVSRVDASHNGDKVFSCMLEALISTLDYIQFSERQSYNTRLEVWYEPPTGVWTVLEDSHLPQSDTGFDEVLPAEDMDAHDITWNPSSGGSVGGGVLFFGPDGERWDTPLSNSDRCFLYEGPTDDLTWWQGVFTQPSRKVWIQLVACDDNDGWADIYVDGVLVFSYNSWHSDYTDVAILGEGLPYRPHTIKIQTRKSSEPGAGDVSLDYVAISKILSARDPNPADGAIGISPVPLLNTYVSGDVPLDIPDRGRVETTVFSSLDIPVSFTITDVNVRLDITQPGNNADLNVFLIGPDGTRVELFTDVGVMSWDDFKNTVLDDEASISVVDGRGRFEGSYRPEGKLSAFDGKNAQGTWKLEITDDWANNVGTLNSWQLIIESPNILSWVPGDNIASQDVYFSNNFNDVNDSADAAYIGNFAADVSTVEIVLDPNQTYFWRIDSLDADGILIEAGDIWSFKTTYD